MRFLLTLPSVDTLQSLQNAQSVLLKRMVENFSLFVSPYFAEEVRSFTYFNVQLRRCQYAVPSRIKCSSSSRNDIALESSSAAAGEISWSLAACVPRIIEARDSALHSDPRYRYDNLVLDSFPGRSVGCQSSVGLHDTHTTIDSNKHKRKSFSSRQMSSAASQLSLDEYHMVEMPRHALHQLLSADALQVSSEIEVF